MENKNLINKIRDLMVSYGFADEKQPEFKSFKVGKDEQLFQTEKLEVGKEIFVINEETGEREPVKDGSYVIDEFKVDIKEGKLEVVKSKFEEVTLIDGSTLNVEGPVEVGSSVYVVSDEGNVPVPDGTYVTNDGLKITTVEGVITEVVEVEPEGEPTGDAEREVELTSEQKFQEILQMFLDFAEAINEKVGKVEMSVNELKDNFNSLKTDYETFKSEPASEPIKDKKKDSELPVNKMDERVKRILELRNKQ